jgi:PAS domain S-box-containing protein
MFAGMPKKLADLRIKWKLTLIILLTSSVSVLLAVSAIFIYDYLQFKQGELEELGVLAEVVGKNCVQPLNENNREKAGMVLSSLATRPRVISAVLTDSGGKTFAEYHRQLATEGEQIQEELLLEARVRSIDISRRVVHQGRIIGRVTIECHVDFFKRNVVQYIKITSLILVITFLAALLLSLLLQRIISHPIKRITSAAERISRGEDYELDIDAVNEDEIGALIRSFQHMLLQINEREAELTKHREHLEELVDQRAAVIKQTNDELRREVWERKRAQHALVRLNEELEDRVNERTHALQDNLAELQTLSEALKRERNIFIDGPVVVFKWRAAKDWPVEYVSSNVDQFGYHDSDLISGNVRYQDIIHAEDRESVLHFFDGAEPTGRSSFEQDYRIITVDGEVRWVYCYLVRVTNPRGRATHYDGYMLDMTERHNIQQALQESEQRLGLALNATNDVMWDWDLRSGDLYLTDKFYTMLGYPEGEKPLTHAAMMNLVHPDDVDYIRQMLQDHVSGQTGDYESECRLQMKGGEYKWVLDRGHVVEWDEEGHPVRMIGTHTDITEQKVVELEISLQRALLKSMINSIPDLIFYKDLDGIYLGCNPAFCEFVGKDWDDVVGRSDHDLFEYSLAEEFCKTDELMLKDAEPRISEQWVHYPDGRRVLLSTLRTPYYGPSGETLGVVGISRNVTAHRQAEQELAEKQTQLVHSGRLAALGEMSTAIAHELGQPLQIIKTSAGIIKEDMEEGDFDPQALLPMVDKVLSQVVRAATIINNVRAFARQDTEGDVVGRIDLRQPIDDALSFFREQFRQHQVQLEVEFQEDVPSVRISPQKFQQVIVNLLSNARYAVDEKGDNSSTDYRKQVTVRLYAEKQAGAPDETFVVMEVRDNGMGMDKFAKERCLDPFFTTKPVGEGTGLGLSILYGIVKDYGGTVDVESIKGKGTSFIIRIPVR